MDVFNNKRLAICVGAGKAGTTTLHEYLSQHPEVSVSTVKENNFFFSDQKFMRGTDWLIKTHHSDWADKSVLFDADPIYLNVPRSLARIGETSSSTAIIVLLREPVSRAVSHHLNRVQLGQDTRSFEEMAHDELDLLDKGQRPPLANQILTRSLYAADIGQLLSVFPRNQVLFLTFDTLTHRPDQAGRTIQRHLSLSYIPLEMPHGNPTLRPRSMLLAKFLYHRDLWPIRRSIGKVLSVFGLKRSILRAIDVVAYEPLGERPRSQISHRLSQRLNALFATDIEETQVLTGLDLSHWQQTGAKNAIELAEVA